MGNHLHGGSQIFSAAFLVQYIPVYLTRRQIGKPVQILIDKPFIMSKIQIRFGTILRDIYLSMLKRTHGSRIHIDVRIQLLRSYL